MRIRMDAEPEFSFIGSLLLGTIGHRCDCESCQDNKRMALSSMLWLASRTTSAPINYQSRPLDDSDNQEDGVGRAQTATMPFDFAVGEHLGSWVQVPEEVIQIVEEAIPLVLDNDKREKLMAWAEAARATGEESRG